MLLVSVLVVFEVCGIVNCLLVVTFDCLALGWCIGWVLCLLTECLICGMGLLFALSNLLICC